MTKRKKKLMILGAGYLQVPGIQKAKEMGYYVIAIDQNPSAPGFKFSDEGVLVSTNDANSVFEAAKEHRIDGIMTLASDRPVNVVAFVAEKLGFPFMKPEDAHVATNKEAMRNRLKDKDIPIPKFATARTLDEFMNVIEDFDDEFITKPADNSGGRGINLVCDRKQAQASYNYSRQFSNTGVVLVEEYMRGHEVSVEAITFSGETEVIAITDKLTSGAPYFVEIGHTVQSSLSSEMKEQIKAITINTVNAIGITNGPSHTEVKITEGGPKIVEIGARLGGGNITSDLVPLATGVDMLGISIKLAMGEAIRISQSENCYASLRHKVCLPGKIRSINGIDEARGLPGVKKVDVLCHAGDTVNPLRSCDDRIAFAIAVGDTADEAIKRADYACSKIIIDIDPRS